MVSSSIRYKEKDSSSRKRRHHSPNNSDEYETKETRRHKHHKKHHRERKREKIINYESEDADSDVIEIVTDDEPSTSSSKPSTTQQDQRSTSGQSSDFLSIEETNKLRAKLGLKPLEITPSSSSANSRKKDDNEKNSSGNKKIKDDWGEFYHRPADNIANKQEEEKLKNKIQTLKEKRQLHNKLNKVKLLNQTDEEDSDLDDAEKWINKSRKLDLEKNAAKKREKLLNELDEQFGITNLRNDEKNQKKLQSYTEKNLKGLAVEHSIDSLKDEQTIILTLKDQNVLDKNDDVLINVNLLDDERYQKSKENLKKKVLYNPYGTNREELFDEDGNLIEEKTNLLEKYDEEIDGVKKKSFKIGEANKKLSVKEKLDQKKLENFLSVNTNNLRIASDYYNETEMEGFKKVKKKKTRKLRTKGKLLTADDLELMNETNQNNKGIESIGTRRPKLENKLKKEEFDFDMDDVDINLQSIEQIKIENEDEKDNLLEQALNKARKLKQKENLIKSNFPELVSSITNETNTIDDNIDNGTNIILNATAEFCRTLGDIPTYGKSGNRDENDDLINEDPDFDRDLIEEDEEENDNNQIPKSNSGWNSVDLNDKKSNINPDLNNLLLNKNDIQILDEEPDVSTGMGAALKLAMSKGYLDKEEQKRPSNSRLAHLQAKHYSIEDKTYNSNDDTDRMSRRERYSGPIMEFKEKDNFKPNVKLEYIDDDGHVLNSKEAFRYLSHKFHGKGPGKNKVEKRLKKSVQQQLMKKMSSTDTPLGTLNMLQAKQKETQSAFVVLSGNKQNQSTVISKARRCCLSLS